MNFWNIKHTKERLAILERTQAQKKHLISIIKAKSIVRSDSNPSSLSRHHVRKPNGSSLSQPCNIRIRNAPKLFEPQKSESNVKRIGNLEILVKELANNPNSPEKSLDKSMSSCLQKSRQRKFINLSQNITQNHHVIFGINKKMQQKKISEENNRMFNRLIQASPTIKRANWVRDNHENLRYKENLNKSKYAKPDYSIEACKMLRTGSTKGYHLKALRHNVGTATTRADARNVKSQIGNRKVLRM